MLNLVWPQQETASHCTASDGEHLSKLFRNKYSLLEVLRFLRKDNTILRYIVKTLILLHLASVVRIEINKCTTKSM